MYSDEYISLIADCDFFVCGLCIEMNILPLIADCDLCVLGYVYIPLIADYDLSYSFSASDTSGRLQTWVRVPGPAVICMCAGGGIPGT